MRGVIAVAVALLAACKPVTPPPTSAQAASTRPAETAAEESELVVSAAASLKDVLDDAITAFAAAHPGTTIRLNVGASGQLAQQILAGAPADVFISADPKWVDKLIEANAGEAAHRRPLAGNELVLIAPVDEERALALEDLADETVARVAVGDPKLVPAGAYAKSVIEQADLWPSVSPKLAFGENVRQVLAYVARGEVDAGFVYRTDARTEPGVTIVQSWPLPPNMYEAILVGSAAERAEARAFMDYLSSDEVKTMLRDAGFIVD